MTLRTTTCFLVSLFTFGGVLANAEESADSAPQTDTAMGPVEVSTIPFDPDLHLRTATYTPSGKVLVVYNKDDNADRRQVNLAVMDDNGENMNTFFSGTIPPREKDNGIRYMIFPDNERIFLGDFVIECEPNIDRCDDSKLLPVEYPEEVASGDHIAHRWSEMIVAPDNKHIAWTTLLANYSAIGFTGKLKKDEAGYDIVDTRIISTLDRFKDDPDNPDGVIPKTFRGGEIKQFVHGGTAISLAGAKSRVTPDTVVQHLVSGEMEQITDTPGYNETTIFSPDEQLGITMTTRFSEPTNMALLGLMPRPYPVSLNIGLSMYIYTYGVTGVRQSRPGNIGPALIDIEASKTEEGYRGINLHTDDEWVYHSPMSWHPSGKKAMWLEGLRGEEQMRMQVVHVPDYKPESPVPAQSTPDDIPYASTDLTAVHDFLDKGQDIDVKVHGRHSGYIQYRRKGEGRTETIEKRYVDFSNDGKRVYNGIERMETNPGGRSTYTADVELTGPKPGVMELKITFGPLGGERPARLIFSEDESGTPLTHGYTEYDGQRLTVNNLVP